MAHVTFGTKDSKANKVWGGGTNGGPDHNDTVWNGFRYALRVVPRTCSALHACVRRDAHTVPCSALHACIARDCACTPTLLKSAMVVVVGGVRCRAVADW